MTFKRTTPISALDLDSSDIPEATASLKGGVTLKDGPLGRWRSKLYGMATDQSTDGVTTNGSPTLTSATAALTSDDVGRHVHGKNFPLATQITAVNSATSVTLGANLTATASSVPFYVGRHIISGGNNGMTLGQWFTTPALSCPYNRNRLVTDNPDLIVYSWLFNDIRQGAMGTTVAACVTAGISLMQSLIDWTRTALPNADILLRMPNTMLTADTNANHFVTDGVTTNPAGQAQIYSTALRRIYMYFAGRYSNVDVIDIQGEVFGTQSAASHSLLADQLHPSPSTQGDLYGLVGHGGGYNAIANAIAKRIGYARNAFAPEGGQRVRHEFIVYEGPSSGTVRLLSREAYGMPAAQAPVFSTDSLYVNGMDSPIALTSATVDRTFNNNILQITGLTGLDFSPYVGRTAVVAGTHAPMSTQDRTQIFIDLPSIAAGATVTQSVTVTGVKTGNSGSCATVVASPGPAFSSGGLLLFGCYPTASDTVRLVINNPTGGAIDTAGESWTFWVLR
jgi:hypothetical protein